MESKADSIFSNTQSIASYDPELWESIDGESNRQEEHIELIASENYASQRIMEAQGSVLTNKYAEGYPHKRYYGGCEYVDIAETLAIIGQKNYSKLIMQMCSLTLDHPLTLQHSWPCFSQTTPF